MKIDRSSGLIILILITLAGIGWGVGWWTSDEISSEENKASVKFNIRSGSKSATKSQNASDRKKPQDIRAPDAECKRALHLPEDFNPITPSPPPVRALYIEKQPDGSGLFTVSYAFRQHFPGSQETDTGKQKAKDPDSYPPHPRIQSLKSDPEKAFIVVSANSVFRIKSQNLQASKTGTPYPHDHYVRYFQGKIPADEYDGAKGGIGYVGHVDTIPVVPEREPVELTQQSCLVRKLAGKIIDPDQTVTILKQNGDTVERKRVITAGKIFSLGRNETTHRILIKYDAVENARDHPNRWSVIADLTAEKLTVRYVAHPLKDPDIIADRNHDGLADLIYFPKTPGARVILLNGTVKTASVRTGLA